MTPHRESVNLSHEVLEVDKAYILQECGQLRNEIWTRVDDQRTTERYTLVACAFIYFFLFTFSKDANTASDEIRTVLALAWYVPPLLGFLAAARWGEDMHMIHLIAHYTETREKEIIGAAGGWESNLHRLRNSPAPALFISGYYAAFWLLLIFSTMTIAAYQHCGSITEWKLSAGLLIGALATMGTLMLLLGPSLMTRIRTSRQTNLDSYSAAT